MAQAITVRNFALPDSAWIPSCHRALADQTASVAAFDTGITTLTWIRVFIYVKTFGTLTTADVFTASVQVGTSTAVTNPVGVAQAAYTVVASDVGITMLLMGNVATGNFESYKITITTSSSHSFTADIVIDCA